MPFPKEVIEFQKYINNIINMEMEVMEKWPSKEDSMNIDKPLDIRNIRCAFGEYGHSGEQCSENAVDELEIEYDDMTGDRKELKIPICIHHEATWLVMYGHKGLAKLIGSGKLFGISI